MRKPSEIVYSICVEDLQTVASEHLSRQLTDKEIHLIENKLGDFIDWNGAIANAIDYCAASHRFRRGSQAALQIRKVA
jgi:hypothetical protein